jgi:phage repressor protein C with HTH and peptisase S24 domain
MFGRMDLDDDDDALHDWKTVKTRLEPRGRGAAYRLAKHLAMNPSYLYRKLNNGGALKTREAAEVRAFLEEGSAFEHDLPAAAPARVTVLGVAAADEGRFLMAEALDRIEAPGGLALRAPYYLVRQVGSLMEPRILAGELLIVTPGIEAATNRDAVLEFTDGTGMVLTYRGRRQGRVFAHRLDEGREENFDATQVKAVHAVFGRL